MLPTHDVPCPRCGQTLYSALSLEDVVDAEAPESPKIERDDKGYYMRCASCSNRIAMEAVSAPRGAAFRPARAV